MGRLPRAWAAAALFAASALTHVPDLFAASPELAPRAPRQDFIPPPPGSYALPPIQPVPDGRVQDIEGRSHPFARYTTGRITLLSFIYTYCSDPLGCPLAYATMGTLRERLLQRPALARQVRFVSLSFDPGHDDPAVLKLYAGPLADPRSGLHWHFLTTASVGELKPLLDGLGQHVSVERNAAGEPTRVRNHLLKLFLIDAQGRVREIYSSAFLLPDVMLNDIETLALEAARR